MKIQLLEGFMLFESLIALLVLASSLFGMIRLAMDSLFLVRKSYYKNEKVFADFQQREIFLSPAMDSIVEIGSSR